MGSSYVQMPAPASLKTPLHVEDAAGKSADKGHRLHSHGAQRLRRIASPLVLCALLVGLLVFSAMHSAQILRVAFRALDLLRDMGRFSPLAVFATQVVVMLCVLPTWPLWLCASAAFTVLWGQLTGLLVAFGCLGLGVWVGSVAAFLLGRYALRPCIAEWTARRPLFSAIDQAVELRGLQIGLFLKLSPLMHTSLSNYVLAATRMRLRHFVLTCPGTFLSMSVWIFAGASLSGFASLDDATGVQAALPPNVRRLMTAVSIFGCALALGALVVVTRASQKVYAELLATKEAATEPLLSGSVGAVQPTAAGDAVPSESRDELL
jgi:uncharacterized membrane protein YdjX (TVP38/TMEM64 family)